MSIEKPTYGILVYCQVKEYNGEYFGINIADGVKLFYNKLVCNDKEIVEYIGLIHALMYIKKNQSALVAYSVNEKILKLIEEKKCVSYHPVRNLGCKDSIERAHKWILFGSKQYFPWRWKTEIWGQPIDMVKKETI